MLKETQQRPHWMQDEKHKIMHFWSRLSHLILPPFLYDSLISFMIGSTASRDTIVFNDR